MEGSDEGNAFKCFLKGSREVFTLSLVQCYKCVSDVVHIIVIIMPYNFIIFFVMFNISLHLILTRIQIFALSGCTNAPQEIPCM